MRTITIPTSDYTRLAHPPIVGVRFKCSRCGEVHEASRNASAVTTDGTFGEMTMPCIPGGNENLAEHREHFTRVKLDNWQP
jgi:hypothetical protein